jgi:hypothetical protein
MTVFRAPSAVQHGFYLMMSRQRDPAKAASLAAGSVAFETEMGVTLALTCFLSPGRGHAIE